MVPVPSSASTCPLEQRERCRTENGENGAVVRASVCHATRVKQAVSWPQYEPSRCAGGKRCLLQRSLLQRAALPRAIRIKTEQLN